MGLPFSFSLHQLMQKVGAPLGELFGHDSSPQQDTQETYSLLLDCYATGQMTDACLEREIAADPEFGRFIETRIAHMH